MELTDLDRVGPARSESLEEAGYATVAEIAEADPEQLAEDADIPGDTALDFVVQAENAVSEEEEEEKGDESDEDGAEEEEAEDGPVPADLVEDDESDEEDAEDSEEDEESEESDEESEEEEDEVHELTVSLESDIHYDVYMKALLDAYERRHGSHQPSLDAVAHALDDARYNSGEVVHTLTEFELNTLHASVSQQVNDYKGLNMIDHMDAMRDILAQVNEVREEELF